MSFDPLRDGADRCEAFIIALFAILKEHQVTIKAKFEDLALVKLQHDGEGPDTGWEIDMQDINFLAE